MLAETDSQELTEWYAYDQRWPLPDHWQIAARLCRIVMSASGNYKRVPEEAAFIPAARNAEQSSGQMWAELMKLKQ